MISGHTALLIAAFLIVVALILLWIRWELKHREANVEASRWDGDERRKHRKISW